MKRIHKRLLVSGAAIVTAGVFGAEALLQTSVSVMASVSMMPGIEEIVSGNSEEEPFRILEISNSKEDAEIGYYVSGQEPYIKLYEYLVTDANAEVLRFSSLEEGLSRLPEKARKEFAANVKIDENGNVVENGTEIKDIRSICGDDAEQYPLSYKEYEEKYFLSEADDESAWKRVNLTDGQGESRTDRVPIHGEYIKDPSSKGDYTKQKDTYYPIRNEDRNTTSEETKKLYVENIQSFFYSGSEEASAPYFLEFEEVANASVKDSLGIGSEEQENVVQQAYEQSFGYFENIYTDLSTDIVESLENGQFTFPGENPQKPEGDLVEVPVTVVQSAKEAFNAGEIRDFTSVNDGSEAEKPAENPVQKTEEAPSAMTPQEAPVLSDGEFSSGASGSDAFVSDGGFSAGDTLTAEPSVWGGASADDSNPGTALLPTEGGQETPEGGQETPESGRETPEGGQDTTEGGQDTTEGGAQEEVILIGIEDNETAGKNSNPIVYLSESITSYPFYKYTKVGDLKSVKTKTRATAEKDNSSQASGTPVVRAEGDITIEDGQYWYWKSDGTKLVKYPLTVVTGKQPVQISDVQEIPEEISYNYYFKVSKVYFCCRLPAGGERPDPESYEYYGWYFPSYKENEDPYIPAAEGGTATHYIPGSVYKLTPGTGDYKFVPNIDKDLCEVEVNHFWYQGGYVNHDWLKKYVFHLLPDDPETSQQFLDFKIEVDTLLSGQFNGIYGGAAKALASLSENVLSGEAAFSSGESSSAEDVFTSEDSNTAAASFTSEMPDTEGTAYASETESEQSTEFGSETEQTDVSETSPVEHSISELTSEEQTEVSLETDSAEAAFISGTDDFAAASSGKDKEEEEKELQLTDYDLVYINGNITDEAAKQIVDARIPCIINSNYYNEVASSFIDFIKIKEDTDGHYVNKYVYVFKWTNSGNWLLNQDFHTNFNPEIQSGIQNGNIQGFEEILEYIENENKYRDLGNSSFTDGTSGSMSNGNSNGITDGTSTNSSGTQANNNRLTKEISQARAVEYILNYKYKRNVINKDTINVLEIQPAKNGDKVSELTDKDIYKWIGAAIDTNLIEKNMEKFDDTDERWATCSTAALNGGQTFTFENMFDGNSETVWETALNHGAKQFPRCHFVKLKLKQASNIRALIYTPRQTGKRGVFKKFNIVLYDSSKKQLNEKPFEYQYQYDESIRADFICDFGEIQKNVKYIYIENIETYDTDKKGASCAELTLLKDLPKININITTMTSSEFVGNIQDLNTEYDMIYWGAKGRAANDPNLINGSGSSMLYTHVGGNTNSTRPAEKERLLGMMQTDYKDDGSLQFPSASSSQVRGSGNDITRQQVDAVLEFAKSGYPVIVSDKLYSNNTLDTNKVDNSSYVYEMLIKLEELKNSCPNICRRSTADSGTMDFYTNLPKPIIVFAEDGKPASAIKENVNDQDQYIENNELRYVFHIEDEAQASTVNAKYNCELYLDLNSDGNFSSRERLDDIQIQDKDGNVIFKNADGKYELSLKEQYIVTRPIPESYIKLITWKLKISNNDRSQIWTTEQGYCKQMTSRQEIINVLQIMKNDDGMTCKNTWNLSTNPTFKKLLSSLSSNERKFEFDIQITTYHVNDYVQKYKDTYKNECKNMLESYDMLIIGFADMFQNIPDVKPNSYENENGEIVTPPGSLTAILNFIKDEKSVLFAHDTTAFYNNWSDSYTKQSKDAKDWGQSFNTILRPLLGLDRYGIKSDSIGSILQKGENNDLKQGSPDWDLVVSGHKGDMAYQANTNRTKTYWQTHGFTNITITNNNGSTKTTQAKQVNEGAITEYPFVISDNLTVSSTHGQYYQLALEEDLDQDGTNDIIVWYCLSGDYYDRSPNDVRNNYYLYSKGNVMYTGVGHSTVNVEEMKLFINTIVASYRASAVAPKVQFVSNFSRTAEKIQSDYYMTDQSVGYDNSEINVVNNTKEIYFTVDDYNLVASDKFSDGSRTMKLELYIDHPKGKSKEGIGTKVKKLDGSLYLKGESDIVIPENEDGTYTVNSGNVYKFVIPNLEEYVTKMDNEEKKIGYINDVKVYARVTSENPKGQGTGKLSLKQRQLFDLN